jgi:pimeloyl-ACP methyl ester carboxylesterase
MPQLLMATIIVLAVAAFYFTASGAIAAATAWVSRVPLLDTPDLSGSDYEEVSFPSRIDNVNLKGWFIPGGDKGSIIVVHGGKQNRADANIHLTELCCDLARRGYDVLTFDRRGCGESDVSKTNARASFDRDVGGAYDYLRHRNGPHEKIFLLGTSIGAASVILFGTEEPGVSAIVADSCFTSVRAQGEHLLSSISRVLAPFAWGASWIGERVYGVPRDAAIDSVELVKCPIFFIHGEDDQGVPVGDSVKLFKASKNLLNELWLVPGAGHCMEYSLDPDGYIDTVVAFIESVCPPQSIASRERVAIPVMAVRR